MIKLKTLLALLGLILIPILANLIFLVIFMLFSVGAVFVTDEQFYNTAKIIKDSLAKFE